MKILTFKDFKLKDFYEENSSYKEYEYSLDDFCYILILKYYAEIPIINQKEKWKLEIWSCNKEKTININFEEQTKDPDQVLSSFNKNKESIYKIIRGIF